MNITTKGHRRQPQNVVQLTISRKQMSSDEMKRFVDDLISSGEYDPAAVNSMMFFLSSLHKLARQNIGEFEERVIDLQRFLFTQTPVFADQFDQYMASTEAVYQFPQR